MAVEESFVASCLPARRAGPTALTSSGRRTFMALTWMVCAVPLAVVATLSGAGGAVGQSVVGSVGLVGASLLAWRASRMRIEIHADALVAHGAVRTVRIPRADVVEVGTAALGNGLRGVAVTRRDGRVVRIDAIAAFGSHREVESAAGVVRAWAGPSLG
jgi:hypothetical protein